jgi:hypothetical protein
VFGASQVAGAVPCTPGGAGVQQALLVKVFATSAPTAVVAAYSVGQQIAIAVFTASVGLGSVVFIFRFRSFKEVLHAGRASQEAERAADRDDARGAGRPARPRDTGREEDGEAGWATEVPRAPRAPERPPRGTRAL